MLPKKRTFALLILLVSYTAITPATWGDSTQPNVLFIAIDDMNDWTGFLGGHPQSITPNLDRLAASGTNFTNAHCSAPACSPSRLALLFGVQPFESGLYPFYDHEKIPASLLGRYTSLPANFRRNGYRAFGAGKIFHGTKELREDWDDYHQPSASKLRYAPQDGYQQGKSSKMAFCPTKNPLAEHPDYQVASYGVEVLSRDHDKPFFLAVGIVKPHLAFVCPQQFFDALPEEIEPPKIQPTDLNDVPWVGRSMAKLSDDFRFRRDKAWGRVHRSYLACISWADYNIGRVLDALEKSPHAENTIVVVWSDHGYHQGEKRSFRKFSLWEESTRVPLIIRDPRIKHTLKNDDHRCDEAVSLIHLYRTLCDLTDIPAPEYVAGESLRSQLIDPKAPFEPPAITTWGRGNYSIRGDRYRFTRYFDGGEELYDHASDPNEWHNLAEEKQHAATKAELASHLPKDETPLVREGISLWNIIDADRPGKFEKFRDEACRAGSKSYDLSWNRFIRSTASQSLCESFGSSPTVANGPVEIAAKWHTTRRRGKRHRGIDWSPCHGG
ncbi:MAG: sulfatase [Planctomycetota bacterium]